MRKLKLSTVIGRDFVVAKGEKRGKEIFSNKKN